MSNLSASMMVNVPKAKAHTPGPWNISPPHGEGTAHRIWRDDGEPGQGYACIAMNVHKSADAHLIAAAPDMLAALKELHDAYLGIHHGEDTHISVRALDAIAKAEGR